MNLMSTAFIFPGQGSQKVGMGRELAEAFSAAREVFEEIDDVLGQKLSSLMWQGPDEDLLLTENAQPALMAVSMAVVRVLEHEAGMTVRGTAAFMAGHSLGEYSACAAAGTFALADAARLLKTRGRAMQSAVAVGEGAMAAVLGMDMAAVREVTADAASGEVCEVANDNAPGQVVVSGHKAAVERAAKLAKDRGASRAILLPVSAPFHCSLMAPAADVMAEALANCDIRPPAVPVVNNVAAAVVTDPDTVRTGLIEQVTGTVRWRESVEFMASSKVDTMIELGAGKVLCGLVRRIDRTIDCMSAGTPADMDKLIGKLQ